VLKNRIHNLQLASRVFSATISVAVFIPLALTVHKFLSTKNIFVMVPDTTNPENMIRRNAWAKNTKEWPTFMYFSIGIVSVVFHFGVLFAYLMSKKAINRAAQLNTAFSGMNLVFQLAVWAITCGIYRYEKDLHGLSNDLWGWTCSEAASALQTVFEKEIQFNTYCNIQVGLSTTHSFHCS
jgi:hypothetical protein